MVEQSQCEHNGECDEGGMPLTESDNSILDTFDYPQASAAPAIVTILFVVFVVEHIARIVAVAPIMLLSSACMLSIGRGLVVKPLCIWVTDLDLNNITLISFYILLLNDEN